MKFIQTTMADLTPEQKDRLRQLTLTTEGSLMRKTLNEYSFPNEVKVIIAVDNLDKWIGWALLRPWFFTQRLIMIFISPSHRRKGIGKSLVKQLREENEFDCYPWDYVSGEFFEALKVKPYWFGR